MAQGSTSTMRSYNDNISSPIPRQNNRKLLEQKSGHCGYTPRTGSRSPPVNNHIVPGAISINTTASWAVSTPSPYTYRPIEGSNGS